VDTNEKKKECFMIGLSTKLQERMTLNTGGTFPEFASNIMITDNAIRAHKETKKRKVVAAPSSSAPPKYRTVYHHGPTYPPQPQHQHQCPQQQWAPRPTQRPHQRATPKALPPPLPVMHLPAPQTAGATSGHTCFNCGRSDHIARECIAPKKTPTQGHVTPPPRGPPKVAVVKVDCVNYTTMEDIPEGEQVLVGMFSLNRCPTTVLFDSGWMKRYKAVLDIAARTMLLESPTHGNVVLKLPPPISIASALHHTVAQNLEDIPVACEFPGVFPEDLSGMPPDQDVEFIIEL
jgi:hypothetical protein